MGSVVLVAAVFAAASVWLILSEPMVVTQAVSGGSVEPLAEVLLDVVGHAVRRVLRWL